MFTHGYLAIPTTFCEHSRIHIENVPYGQSPSTSPLPKLKRREDAMQMFPCRRITVTGGAGFLGRHVVGKLRALPGLDVFVPRSKDYNLVEGSQVVRLFEESRPEMVIHLAAVVGGIGYNQQNPGRFLYENLMMGTQL